MRFILLLLISLPALANDIYLKVGPGVLRSADQSPIETKAAFIGYQGQFSPLFSYQLEAGGFYDMRGDMGRSSSIVFRALSGLDIQTGYLYTQALIGGAWVSSPDAYLGSSLNFTETLGFGLRDNRGVSIGIEYNHISNGGIVQPNIGRDFLFLRLSIPLDGGKK